MLKSENSVRFALSGTASMCAASGRWVNNLKISPDIYDIQ